LSLIESEKPGAVSARDAAEDRTELPFRHLGKLLTGKK